MFRADPAGAGGSKGEQDAPVNVGRHFKLLQIFSGLFNISKYIQIQNVRSFPLV